MSATQQASNGAATVTSLTLPATIAVEINGVNLTCEAKPSDAGNIWYEGVQNGQLRDGADLVAAMLAASVKYQGEQLPTGKRNTAADGSRVIATTNPRKYPKDHAQAGQNVPGTGGNPIVSFVKTFPEWGERGYQLVVMLTGITDGDKRFVQTKLSCQGTVTGKSRIVGHLDGDLTFG